MTPTLTSAHINNTKNKNPAGCLPSEKKKQLRNERLASGFLTLRRNTQNGSVQKHKGTYKTRSI